MFSIVKIALGGALTALVIFGAAFVYLGPSHEFSFGVVDSTSTMQEAIASSSGEATKENTEGGAATQIAGSGDIAPQPQLQNLPPAIKAVYATGYSAGSTKKTDYLLKLIRETELNAVVIDIKDYSGYVLYDTDDPDVLRYSTKQVQIPRVNAVIKKFHDAGVYVIARLTVFQDPALARARPDWAVQKTVTSYVSENGTTTAKTSYVTWTDNKGLAWMDPANKQVWDYNIAIAKDALARGFDEVNFDYIRFASDGSLGTMHFPYYDPTTQLKVTVISKFFKYLSEQLEGAKISADLFGLTTVNNDDLGIGQSLTSAAPYFDALAPMVYPSHYASGFIGYAHPAEYPYEVIQYSMDRALSKLIKERHDMALKMTASTPAPVSGTANAEANGSVSSTEPVVDESLVKIAKLRPWIQDFDLGATYDIEKVKAEIKAINDVLLGTPYYDGFMVWNPSNIYTQGAFEIE